MAMRLEGWPRVRCLHTDQTLYRRTRSAHRQGGGATVVCGERARLVDGAAPYAVFSIGGALGRISANATWMIPPASPSATPIRHAMV